MLHKHTHGHPDMHLIYLNRIIGDLKIIWYIELQLDTTGIDT